MNDDAVKVQLRSLSSLKGPFPAVNMDILPNTPQEAFHVWLNDAIAEGIKEPHAMTLSTVDADGFPDARILILKNVDARGWHFAIKANSPKGWQLAGRPHAALTFYWPELGRQIRLRGEVMALPEMECADDFSTRPPAARISAVASRQSEVLENIEDLEKRLREARELFEENPGYIETGWRVFALAPRVVEFWQGATDRLHKRLRYSLEEGGAAWAKQMLWP